MTTTTTGRGRHRTNLDTTPIPGITHGKHSSYTYHGCRCDECRAVHLAYMRTYDTRKDARGTRPASPEETAQAINLLQQLHDHGWTLQQIAEAGGISARTLNTLRRMKPHQALTKTTRAIRRAHEALTGQDPTNQHRRAVQRVQALRAMGWTILQIAEVAEVHPNSISRILHDKRQVGTSLARSINQAWETLTARGPKPARRRPVTDNLVSEAEEKRTVTPEEATALITTLLDQLDISANQLADRAMIASRTLTRITTGRVTYVSDNTMTALEEIAHQEGIHGPA